MAFVIKEEWKIVTCSQDENSVDKGIRGILPRVQIERMYRDTSADEKEARRRGVFTHLKGQIFKDFRAQPRKGEDWSHVFPHDSVFKPNKTEWHDWTNYLGTDTHPVKPFYSLLVKIDPMGDPWVFDEIIENGVEDTASAVRDLLENSGGRDEEEWMIEPQAKQGKDDDQALHSIIRQFQDEGFFTKPWKKHNTPRIRRVQTYLKFNESRGKPRLMISDRCTTLIAQLKIWCANPITGKPEDKNDDLPDVLGGILCEDPTYVPNYSQEPNTQYTPQGYGNGY